MTLGLLWTTLFLSQLISLIYPDLTSIIYVAYVQSNALFPSQYPAWLHCSLRSMPLSVPGLIIVTPSSLAYQNPAWLNCNLSLTRLIVRIPRFSHIEWRNGAFHDRKAPFASSFSTDSL